MILDFSMNIFKSDTFTLPVTQEEIGNMVDSSRETVSRVFNEFEKDGIISIQKKQINILNKSTLNSISDNG
jgi:CRP/FNR family transcriptional regulator